jgi:co-chaperonin GroES (HSP10)
MIFTPRNGYMLVLLDNLEGLLTGIVLEKDSIGRKEIVLGSVVESGSPDISAGTKVCFPFYAASEIILKNVKYYILSEQDVLGTIQI